MMELIKQFFLPYWKNPKHRLKIILAGAVALLLFILAGQRTVSTITEEKPVVGSVKAVRCVKCGFTEDRRILDIDDPSVRCSKCGGKIGLRQKCNACGFEFVFIRPSMDVLAGKNKEETFKLFESARTCSNCGSTDTDMMSPTHFPEK